MMKSSINLALKYLLTTTSVMVGTVPLCYYIYNMSQTIENTNISHDINVLTNSLKSIEIAMEDSNSSLEKIHNVLTQILNSIPHF